MSDQNNDPYSLDPQHQGNDPQDPAGKHADHGQAPQGPASNPAKPATPSTPAEETTAFDAGSLAGNPSGAHGSDGQAGNKDGANPYASFSKGNAGTPGTSDSFQSYPSVNHPEDNPGFDAPGTSSTGNLPPYPGTGQSQQYNPYGTGVGDSSASTNHNGQYGQGPSQYGAASGTGQFGQPGGEQYGQQYGQGFNPNYGQGFNQGYGRGYGSGGFDHNGNGYQAGSQAVPGQVHPRLQWPYRQGNDTFNFGEAFTFGVKSVFFDPLIWILGTFVLGVLSIGTSYAGSNETLSAIASLLNFLTAILSLLVMPVVYHFALRSLNGYRLELETFREELHYGTTLGVVIVSNIISFAAVLPGLIGLLVVAFASMGDYMVEDVSAGAILTMVFFIFLSIFGAVLVGPFIMLAPFYAADGMSFGDAFKAAFADGKRRYWQLLGFSIVLGLAVFFVTLITCGLAGLIAAPASYLALAYVYRSVSGRIYPTQQVM